MREKQSPEEIIYREINEKVDEFIAKWKRNPKYIKIPLYLLTFFQSEYGVALACDMDKLMGMKVCPIDYDDCIKSIEVF